MLKLSNGLRTFQQRNDPPTPYPSTFEIVRYILRSFDLKHSKKHLDDLLAQVSSNPVDLTRELHGDLAIPLDRYFGTKEAGRRKADITNFLFFYLHKIVGKLPAHTLDRKEVITALAGTCFKAFVWATLRRIHRDLKGPQSIFWLSKQQNSVSFILECTDHNHPNWRRHRSLLSKENRDTVDSCQRGKHIPAAHSIISLCRHDRINPTIDINWPRLRSLLFFARAIEFTKTYTDGRHCIDEARLALMGAPPQPSIATIASL